MPLVDYQVNPDQQHVVCDRWHLGELVYPRVFGRPTQLTDPVLRHIEMFLQSRAALIILLDAPLDDLTRCVDTRGDDLVSTHQLAAIREGFHDVLKVTTLPVIHVDHNDVRDTRTVDWIVGEAMMHASQTVLLEKFVTYVGPRWPKLLLLGDVRATGADPGDRRPAFMPYGATSGYYLLDALGDAATRDVGIANACDVDDAQAMRNAFGSGGEPVVVALGGNARRAAPWADRFVPHPQYIRRFHHNQGAAYRDAILGISPWTIGTRADISST